MASILDAACGATTGQTGRSAVMKAMKSGVFGLAVALTALLPLQGANAWDHYGGGYRGDRYGGGYPGGYSGGYHGDYHGGRWNGGAAVAGLILGTMVGAAMVEAARPPVVVAPAPPPPCRSVLVNGVPYYNCESY